MISEIEGGHRHGPEDWQRMQQLGREITGAAMATDRLVEEGLNYVGRVNFGKGEIDATDVTRDEFMGHLKLVQSEGLVRVVDYKQVYGGCMDGRPNVEDELGGFVAPRPKVIAGPSGFAWYVAAIGGYSILKPGMSPIEQFEAVNQRLVDAEFKLGMHYQCGGARAPGPISGNYAEQMDEINELVGSEVKELVSQENGRHLTVIRKNLDSVLTNLANKGSDFTEDAMHSIVRELSGPEALIHLASDGERNHGHDEDGIVFLRANGVVINKDAVTQKSGRQIFYQNIPYAKAIIGAIARTDEEYARGVIIADQLPLAGVATLGRGQHVGEITQL